MGSTKNIESRRLEKNREHQEKRKGLGLRRGPFALARERFVWTTEEITGSIENDIQGDRRN